MSFTETNLIGRKVTFKGNNTECIICGVAVVDNALIFMLEYDDGSIRFTDEINGRDLALEPNQLVELKNTNEKM